MSHGVLQPGGFQPQLTHSLAVDHEMVRLGHYAKVGVDAPRIIDLNVSLIGSRHIDAPTGVLRRRAQAETGSGE